ncbi:MAG: polymerase, sigma-24 subunit, subfamily, partial [Frankiales bacterium]|nr:polymerase, sigma-24 subunit, subfamily [Frankiales bacterium]
DAEDVVQDALVRAWRHRRRFDPSLGTPRAWLLTIVANEARRRRGPVVEPLLDAAVHDPAIDVDLERAIRSLSRQQRLVVELYYYLDLPVADVATVMAVSPGTVKSTLADARRRLELLLKVDA